MKSERDPGKRSRRQHDRAFKEELVRQSLEPDASVSAIALSNGINANMLFKWRREHLRATGQRAAPTVLLPVEVPLQRRVRPRIGRPRKDCWRLGKALAPGRRALRLNRHRRSCKRPRHETPMRGNLPLPQHRLPHRRQGALPRRWRADHWRTMGGREQSVRRATRRQRCKR